MRTPEFWSRDGFAAHLLNPIGEVYGAATRMRLAWSTPWRAPVPIVCVGNLVAGGAGKTPVAMAIAAHLSAREGFAPALLSRGYGGSNPGPTRVDPEIHDASDVGDEALLLARVAPTWIARKRDDGARTAIEGGADAIIMDDGLQNPSLIKDLSIAVIDGQFGFGNGRLIPAGPLRERWTDARPRLDAAVVIDGFPAPRNLPFDDDIEVLHARIVPTSQSETLAGQKVVAFAGIGRPDKFFKTVQEMSCELVDAVSFPDHHSYDEDELMQLIERAAALGAVPVTTAKDAVRMPPTARAMVQVVDIVLSWSEPDAIDRLLAPIVDRGLRAN